MDSPSYENKITFLLMWYREKAMVATKYQYRRAQGQAPVGYNLDDFTWWANRVASAQGREVCSGLELLQILPPDALPSPKVTLILGNNKISETSLSSVILQYLWCFRTQRPWTRSMTSCSKYLMQNCLSKNNNNKILCDIQQFAMVLGLINVWWEGGKDGRTGTWWREAELELSGWYEAAWSSHRL